MNVTDDALLSDPHTPGMFGVDFTVNAGTGGCNVCHNGNRKHEAGERIWLKFPAGRAGAGIPFCDECVRPQLEAARERAIALGKELAQEASIFAAEGQASGAS